MAKTRLLIVTTPIFSNKDPVETEKFFWDFKFKLVGGETISTAAVTATVVSGVDPTPQNIVSGSAVISGTQVKQLIIGGGNGVVYQLDCMITTSAPHTYHGIGNLGVANS